MATDAETRGRVLELVYRLRHSNGGVVPISDTNFTGTGPIRFEVISAACSHLAKAGLIDWTPALGQQTGATLGFAHITGPGVDVFEGHITPPINIKIPGPEKPPRIVTSESATGYGSGGYGSETFGGAPPKGAEDILAPTYATPFEIELESELASELKRFNNEWLVKWHALEHGGSVDVEAFDGRRIHYGGIKFETQQQFVYWQAIGRYLNLRIHEYFKRWETETVDYPNSARRQSLNQLESELRAFTAKIISLSIGTVRRLLESGTPQSVSAYDSAGRNTQAITEIVQLSTAHRQLLDQAHQHTPQRPNSSIVVNGADEAVELQRKNAKPDRTVAAIGRATGVAGAAGVSASTAIGRAVIENRAFIELTGASLLALIEARIETLRQARSNSDEAHKEISDLEEIKRRAETFLIASVQFIAGENEENELVQSKVSLAEGLNNIWGRYHLQIGAIGILGVGVLLCHLSDPLSVAVAGSIVGGKHVVEAIKAIFNSDKDKK